MSSRLAPNRRVRRGQRGLIAVSAAVWAAVLASFTWITLTVTMAVANQHHLDAAADLAALAAAEAVQDAGGDPCGAAAVSARRNRAGLVSCRVEGEDVVVTLSRRLPVVPGYTVDLRARARAGPVGAP